MKKEANILKIQKGTLVVLNYVNVRTNIAEISNLDTTYTETIDYVGESKLLDADIYDSFGTKANNQLPNFVQDHWISPPETEYKNRIELNESVMELVYTMLEFVGKDALRLAMNGICFNSDGICATDANKLIYTFDSLTEQEYILPIDIFKLLKLKKVKKCIIQLSDKYAKVEVGNFKIESRLINERFPNFRAVIPERHDLNTFEVDKKEMLSALKYVKPAVNKTTQKIKVKLDQQINISAECLDNNTSADINIELGFNTGYDLEIGFNVRLLEICLKCIKSDKVKFEYSDAGKAVLIGDNCLLMPVIL